MSRAVSSSQCSVHQLNWLADVLSALYNRDTRRDATENITTPHRETGTQERLHKMFMLGCISTRCNTRICQVSERLLTRQSFITTFLFYFVPNTGFDLFAGTLSKHGIFFLQTFYCTIARNFASGNVFPKRSHYQVQFFN